MAAPPLKAWVAALWETRKPLREEAWEPAQEDRESQTPQADPPYFLLF